MNVSASKISEIVAVVGVLAPVSASSVTYLTAYFKADKAIQYAAIIQLGVMGAGTVVNASWLQGNTSAGGSPKAITGASAITAMTQTPTDQSGNVVILNLRPEMMDNTNGFYWATLAVTPSVGAALISAVVVALGVKDGPATNANLAAVAELAN